MSLPTRPDGGPAMPVSVVSSGLTEGGIAIPVYGYDSQPTDRAVIGMPARRVKVLTSADLIQNGGGYSVQGVPYAMPVYTSPSGLEVVGESPIAVYPINSWPTPPVYDWWEPEGIATCVAAYKPKGAADLASSYINLANPGTFNATVGVAPTLSDGWAFNGTTQYLITGVIPAANWSAFVQITNGTSAGLTRIVFGELTFGVDTGLYIGTKFVDSGCGFANGAGTTKFKLPILTSGNLGVAGNKAFRDGVDEGLTLDPWSGTATQSIYIGGRNFFGLNLPWAGTVTAWAIFSSVLTQSQITTLVASMAAF